jgi:hypothetical protein
VTLEFRLHQRSWFNLWPVTKQFDNSFCVYVISNDEIGKVTSSTLKKALRFKIESLKIS